MDTLDFFMLVVVYAAATVGIVVLCWEFVFPLIAEDEQNDDQS